MKREKKNEKERNQNPMAEKIPDLESLGIGHVDDIKKFEELAKKWLGLFFSPLPFFFEFFDRSFFPLCAALM